MARWHHLRSAHSDREEGEARGAECIGARAPEATETMRVVIELKPDEERRCDQRGGQEREVQRESSRHRERG